VEKDREKGLSLRSGGVNTDSGAQSREQYRRRKKRRSYLQRRVSSRDSNHAPRKGVFLKGDHLRIGGSLRRVGNLL